MAGQHFISYSRADAADFAQWLHQTLSTGVPPAPVWLDIAGGIRPGDDWDDQLDQALKTCRSLLFVMSADSVDRLSECKSEWDAALRYKKPVIPLLLHGDAEAPYRLRLRQYLDFTTDRDAALGQLRTHFHWMDSPEGQLKELEYRLADARRMARRAGPTETARIENEVAYLTEQIARQGRIVADPAAATEQARQSIESRMQAERQPERPPAPRSRGRFINRPPAEVPGHFQDRYEETKWLASLLRAPDKRLIKVVGRGGVGKTAMVCRLLDQLQHSNLPANIKPLNVDGIVYETAASRQQSLFPKMFRDLCRLLPPDDAKRLEALAKDPYASTTDKMSALLAQLPQGLTILLLDNFEDQLDPKTRRLDDTDLAEALRTVLTAPPHGLKVVLTTRYAPSDLPLVERGRQEILPLNKGLPSPFAENVLRAMDPHNTLGLRDAPDERLAEICQRTRGYPRALEALCGILESDFDTSLEDVLADTEKLLPDHVIDVLVGEAFSRLDATAQQVMQALAIYAPHPVPAVAVDHLLEPYVPGVDSSPILGRLVNMQFARKEGGRYYLHPVDCDYALARVPESAPDGNGNRAAYTQTELRLRAADYFAQTQRPREQWKTLDDLEPAIAEFDMRCRAGDHDQAAYLLLQFAREHLYKWGHYALMLDLGERVRGNLSHPLLRALILMDLGSAHAKMAQIHEAIACEEEALKHAVAFRRPTLQAATLNALGLRHYELGRTAKATELFEQAIAVAQFAGDTNTAAHNNLARCHADLGDFAQAEHHYGVASEDNTPSSQAIHKENTGQLLLDQSRLDEGIGSYREAIRVADDIPLAQVQSWGRWGLARGLVLAGDAPGARRACEEARQFDVPENNHRVLSVLGIACLLDSDPDAARQAFADTMEATDRILVRCADFLSALECKGMALCGLCLCDGAPLDPALEALQAARALNSDPIVIQRVHGMLQAMAPADPDDRLAPARDVANQPPEKD